MELTLESIGQEQRPTHLVDDLALYALGALGADETRAVEVQLAADAALRAELRAYEAVAASLALAAPEVAPAATLRERLLARIAEPEPNAVSVKPSKPVPPLLSIRADAQPWMQLAEKVFCKTLFVDPHTGMVTSLVKLEPGGFLPRHRHLGIEQSLVIEGDCRVNGEVFYPGDFRVRAPETEDTEVTTEYGTIIMLIAPPHFENLDPRWPC